MVVAKMPYESMLENERLQVAEDELVEVPVVTMGIEEGRKMELNMESNEDEPLCYIQ